MARECFVRLVPIHSRCFCSTDVQCVVFVYLSTGETTKHIMSTTTSTGETDLFDVNADWATDSRKGTVLEFVALDEV